ncbi:glycosyltransferase family 2 protein [Cantharellus anzutake]|uniref:glycosyltransferase family 2 protein n=1 Tax=Cantharellus anzutake TaxID=1750568 RepID=UPI001903BFF5|nr:glycosyltransferase family 2 protein [Cantharellus anzutake]KAF8326625.1 glycosyltransferase family 2 protein [Cantharellus anzutake]
MDNNNRFPQHSSRPQSPYADPFNSTETLNQEQYRQNPFPSQTYQMQSLPTQYSTPSLAPSLYEPRGEDEEQEEEKPLTAPTGTYPPQTLVDPGSFGAPTRPGSTDTSTTDREWRHRQTIRRGVTKRVKLTSGNFITEHDVPTPVKRAVQAKWANTTTTEFTHMRYTAATCDPDDFTTENGWSLRVSNYNRPTDLLIAVTSYNEVRKVLYARTLHGVMLNIRDICKTKTSKYWRKSAEEGLPGWQRICVALIVDGLEPMDKTVLDILATVGVYQDGVMKKDVDGKETVAHIFEYTTQLSVDGSLELILPHGDDSNNLVPVQIILIIKAKNQKKINSHRWLFNGIGKMLNPEICVLLDAGTKPGHKSIYYLWEAFYNDPWLGGACGEIHAMIKGGKKLLNPLVAAQNFEYKMSNILDKPTESSFGYVSVLPGAFSAYRYRAIQGRPLEQYFHGDHSMAERLGKKGIYGMDIFTKNMFLAEDRILCFELVAKAGDRWILNYVKPSKAETDVPESATELIGQRRRWLNGSFAASVYALVHFFRFYKSSHGPIRMFFFHFQALYNLISLIFSWFALANFYLTFSIIIKLLPEQNPAIDIFGSATITHWVNLALEWTYLGFLALQFILALGNRPKGEKLTYIAGFVVFALLSVYLIACSLWLTGLTFKSISFKTATISSLLTGPAGVLMAALLGTFGVYLFSSLLYGDPWHILTSMPQYLLMAMSWTNIIQVYAFNNLHDVNPLPSVSTKKVDGNAPAVAEVTKKTREELDDAFKETVDRATSKPKKDATVEKPTMDDENKTFRTRFVAAWMLSNAGLSVTIESLNGLGSGNLTTDEKTLQNKQHIYFSIILWTTFLLSAVRFVGCFYYFLKRNLFRWCRRN